MKLPVRIAFVLTLISIAITFGFYMTDNGIKVAEMSPLWNMFLLVSSIGLSLFLVSKANGFKEISFIEDFKNAMQGGLIFVILISIFTLVYHQSVDTSFVDQKLNERLEANMKNVPNEAAYLELQIEDPTWQGKSYLDYMENQEDQTVLGLSSKSLALGHLVVGLFLALAFSIFATFVFRFIVLKDINK